MIIRSRSRIMNTFIIIEMIVKITIIIPIMTIFFIGLLMITLFIITITMMITMKMIFADNISNIIIFLISS